MEFGWNEREGNGCGGKSERVMDGDLSGKSEREGNEWRFG